MLQGDLLRMGQYTWCDECKSGWCAGCEAEHECDPRPPLEMVDAHLASNATDFKTLDSDQGWLTYGVSSEELKTEVAIDQAFRRLQQEEDQRKGDFSGIGSRYGYCHFVGPSLRDQGHPEPGCSAAWGPWTSVQRAVDPYAHHQWGNQRSGSSFKRFAV